MDVTSKIQKYTIKMRNAPSQKQVEVYQKKLNFYNDLQTGGQGEGPNLVQIDVLKDRLDKACSSAKEASELKKQIQDLKNSYEDQIQELQAKLAEHSGTAAEAETIKSNLGKIQNDLSTAKGDLDDCNEREAKANEKLTQLTGQLAELKAQLDTAKAKVSELEGKNQDNEAKEETIGQLNEQIRQLTTNLEECQKSVKEANDALNKPCPSRGFTPTTTALTTTVTTAPLGQPQDARTAILKFQSEKQETKDKDQDVAELTKWLPDNVPEWLIEPTISTYKQEYGKNWQQNGGAVLDLDLSSD